MKDSPRSAENPAVPRQPNIVMIFTEDQRHHAVGYSGNSAIHTPSLDRLAKNGLVFENCFVNTSICAISRANLLSGQYPARHGIDDFFKTFSPQQLRQTVPARLRRAGYQTALIGKWGIGDSPESTHQGAAVFDYWAGQAMQTCYFHEADCRYVRWNGFDRPLDDLCDCPADSRGKVGYRNRIGRANLKEPIHVDSQVTPIHVERFLNGRDPNKPFCLMLFFKSPHGPFTDWDPTVAYMTDDLEMPVPPDPTLANAQCEPELIKRSLGRPSGMNYLTKTGRDLTVLQKDPATPLRDDFYYDHPYGHRGMIPRTVGVRDKRYVYTRYIDPSPPFEQLFDLQQDP